MGFMRMLTEEEVRRKHEALNEWWEGLDLITKDHIQHAVVAYSFLAAREAREIVLKDVEKWLKEVKDG